MSPSTLCLKLGMSVSVNVGGFSFGDVRGEPHIIVDHAGHRVRRIGLVAWKRPWRQSSVMTVEGLLKRDGPYPEAKPRGKEAAGLSCESGFLPLDLLPTSRRRTRESSLGSHYPWRTLPSRWVWLLAGGPWQSRRRSKEAPALRRAGSELP